MQALIGSGGQWLVAVLAMCGLLWCEHGEGQRESVTFEVGGEAILWNSPAEIHLPLSFYQDWANNQTVFINDTLYFSYNSSVHDVTFVGTKEELMACDISNISAGEGTGASYWTVYLPITYYIMSSRRALNGTNISRDCQKGMKFELVVHDLSSPSPIFAPLYPPKASPPPSNPTPMAISPSSSLSIPQVHIEIPWQLQPNKPNFYTTYLQDQLRKSNTPFLPAGSSIAFRYTMGKHNVLRVNLADFNTCTIPTKPIALHENPNIPIELLEEGNYFFIDGLNDNCATGNMRVSVQVGPNEALLGSNSSLPAASEKHFPIVGVLVPSAIILVCAAVGIFCFCTYQAKAQGKYTAVNTKGSGMSNLLAANAGRNPCKVFTLEELDIATDNFSSKNVIGCGGFGTVYKGKLDNGAMVAIKKAKHAGGDDVEQFFNEISILSQVNHRNLVKLFGYGVVLEEPFLVYEYISNGNLQEHLAKAQLGISDKLSWTRRFNIAIQTAEALKYLHVQASPPIFHRDVKSANILLDQDFNAKVADFGLSKLINSDGTHVSTMVKGTPGYLDPDYFQNFVLTDKSDVYSFGVVLLELITSRKPIDTSKPLSEQNIALSSIPLIMAGRVNEILDQQLSLSSIEDFREIEGVAQVAASCLIPDRTSRPSMSEVVEMLQRIKGFKQADEFLNKFHKRPHWIPKQPN